MAAAADGLGTEGRVKELAGGVEAGTEGVGGGTMGAVGALPVVPNGVATGIGEAGVAAGLAVSPKPGLDGVPVGVKKKPPGEGEAGGGGVEEAAALAAGLAGAAGTVGEEIKATGVTAGVEVGVEAGVGRGLPM